MKKKIQTALPQQKNHLRVPILFTYIFHSLVFCFLAGVVYSAYIHRTSIKPVVADKIDQPEKMQMVQNRDYNFVKPLRLTDLPVESEQMKGVKHDILMYLETQKKAGQLDEASVYLRRMNDGDWISINDNETFKPGSMFKIPLLIYYLKVAETYPGYLKREFVYDRPIANPKHETFKGNSLVFGKKYKVEELLNNMIVYSDNIATTLLLLHMEKPAVYQKIYSDLGIPVPDPKDDKYKITAKDISKFMRVLYSSTYLNESSSEYAMELMTRSDFNDGIANKLPKDVKIARKFGEAGDAKKPDFSETGIIYSGNNTYLLTVMTRGAEPKQQAETISGISKIVYDEMKE